MYNAISVFYTVNNDIKYFSWAKGRLLDIPIQFTSIRFSPVALYTPLVSLRFYRTTYKDVIIMS